MNATVMAMLLIAVHVMICVLMCVLSRFGVLRVEGRLLPFMLLVPLWGPLCVLLLHVRTLIRAGEHTAPGLEQMRVDDEERRSILVEERTDFANTVPLEEALIVNGPSHRRSLVMSILNDNPSRYIDVLSQARLNEDVEVVHYAATALAQISAKEDLALAALPQRLSAASKFRNDVGTLLRCAGTIYQFRYCARIRIAVAEAAICRSIAGTTSPTWRLLRCVPSCANANRSWTL